MSELDTEELLKGDERIIAEAKRRFKQCESWESNARKLFLDDLKFANADSDNLYQWPNDIRRNRDLDERPCLTINKTKQHCLQIVNEAKQNKPSITFRPVGNGATYEAAQVFEGIARHIEYISNAEVAYDTATMFQVEAGIGYWRVVTDYAGDDSFDQEIYIRRIPDPLNVFLDPDINEVDGSDARFGFIFRDMPEDEFNAAYPKYKREASTAALGNGDGWIDKEHVRIAEYFRRVPKEDRLISFTNPNTGETETLRLSKVPGALKALAKAVIDDPETKHRIIEDDEVQWFLIIGDKIVEKTIWPGKTIPIVRCIGEETIIDGELDRKGHTRALKDPQRMYNYFSSSAVENLALQSKIPYVAPAQAIEGQETYWETANTVNHSILPYNHRDDDGNEIPAPARAQPPTQSTGYLEAMNTAKQEMMMVSGQYEANFGQKSNETSGKAINERQRQGDTATYHFIDNLGIAIRYTGEIILDLIPKIYDTPRIIRILGEDGTESQVQLNPNAQQAYLEKKSRITNEVQSIFNPNVGRYEVMADVGPGYATKRQEAWNALTQIIAHNPELVHVAGDLLFRNADFPGAEEIAERLERMVPAQAKGNAPPPEMQQIQQQLQQAQQINGKLLQTLAEERLKLKGEQQQKEIDGYKAITERMNVLEKHFVTPKAQVEFLHDLAMQEHASNLQIVTDASKPTLEQDAEAR